MKDGLRGSLSAGFAVLALGTVANKGINLLAQLALGRLLLPSDFGLYAAAASITLLVRTFQDTGVREVIVQARKDALPGLRGPVFWMATAINGAVGLGLFLFAPVLSFLYEGAVVSLLQVVAVWIAVSSPWAFFSAILSRGMRFRALASLNAGWSVIQFGGTVLLALRGFGALSFVLPLPLASLSMAVVGYLLCREQPWRHAARVKAWPRLLANVKWLALGRAAFAVFSQGDFLILSLTVSSAVLGVYYFAYQLPGQVVALLSVNLHAVLFPAFARMTNDMARRATNIREVMGVLMVGVSLFCGSVIVSIAPLEALLWGDRWEQAVLPIQLLSIALPFRALFDVAGAVVLADGRFRLLALLQSVQGLGLMLVAGLCGILLGSPTAISAGVAVYLFCSGLLFSALALAPLGVRPRNLYGASLPVWMGSVGSAGVALLAVSAVGVNGLMATLVLQLGLFAVVFTLFLRFKLPELMKQAVSVLPEDLGDRMRTVLLLNN